MSFVLSVRGGNFAIMMSVGRVNKSGDKRVAGEEFQKVFKLNDQICLGITGDPVAVYYALNELHTYELERMTMERMKRILVNAVKEIPVNRQGVQIILSGSNKSNRYVTYSVDTKRDPEEILFDSKDCPGFGVVYTGSDLPEIQQIVDKHIPGGKVWESLGEIRDHMEACIKEIATVDDSVNDTVYDVMVVERQEQPKKLVMM